MGHLRAKRLVEMHPWTHVKTQTAIGADFFSNPWKDIATLRFPVAYRAVFTTSRAGSTTVAEMLGSYRRNIGPEIFHDSFSFK
jgi:hypothetical protein